MSSNLLKELAELHKPAPAAVDPELEDGRDWAASKGRTHRVRRVDEDPKYSGRRVSRKQLQQDAGLFADGAVRQQQQQQQQSRKKTRSYDDESDESEVSDDDDDEDDEGMPVAMAIGRAASGKARAGRRKSAAMDDSDEEDDEDEEDEGDSGSDDSDDAGEGNAAAKAKSLMGGLDDREADRMAREYEALQKEEAAAVQSLSTDVVAQVEKGRHAKNQLSLWESFMELRIRMQRAVGPCNALPAGDLYAKLIRPKDAALQEELAQCRAVVADLAEVLLSVQEELMDQFSSFAEAATDDNGGIALTEGGEAEDADRSSTLEIKSGASKGKRALAQASIILDEELEQRHKRFKPVMNATIDKWNTKTRLASNHADKSFKALDRRILDQIDEIIADRERLIKRTQLMRNPAPLLGEVVPEEEEEDTEDRMEGDEEEAGETRRRGVLPAAAVYKDSVFDDTDFYHELLRELISSKTDVASMDPTEMGRHWLEVDKLRSKIKRKIDTKASKGRKLRYHVHPKLISFMAPDDTAYGAPDTAKDALCGSLFSESTRQ